MRYVLYLSGRRPSDEHRRQYVPIFEDITLAKAMILAFMGNEPIIPVGDVLEWGETFKLKTSKLHEILAAPDVALPDPYAKHILLFKYGHWEKPAARPVDNATANNATGARTPSSTRERRPERPAGYVTITELAATWGIPALHARTALRGTDRVKPPYGWAFAPADVPAIKKICGVQ